MTDISEGYNFLGWNFRKYKNTLLIKPSKGSQHEIIRKISEIIHKAKAWDQDRLIRILNPIIRGWAQYHNHAVSTAIFSKLDDIVYNMLVSWAKRRHQNKGTHWIMDKYWHTDGNRKYVFCTENQTLERFSNTKIVRQRLAKLDKNPYIDRNYFEQWKRTEFHRKKISPLLANLTLDGIESLLAQRYPKEKVYFIRYADDFLVTAPTKEMAEEIREVIREFLGIRGLELSEKKTTITHIDDGFDFLGWNFRKYRGKLLIKPSRKSIGRITEKIRKILQKAAAWTQDELIAILNKTVVGWANYHRHIVAADTFGKLDHIVWNMLWKWAKRRHPEKGHQWTAKRYWHIEGNRKWVFKTGKNRLKQFSDTKIRRHTQVRLDANPFLDRHYLFSRINVARAQSPESQTKLYFFSYCRPVTGL